MAVTVFAAALTLLFFFLPAYTVSVKSSWFDTSFEALGGRFRFFAWAMGMAYGKIKN
jgi:hypothetical protein